MYRSEAEAVGVEAEAEAVKNLPLPHPWFNVDILAQLFLFYYELNWLSVYPS